MGGNKIVLTVAWIRKKTASNHSTKKKKKGEEGRVKSQEIQYCWG